MIKYQLPHHWVAYDSREILAELSEAKGAVMALTAVPFQRRWVEELQKIQLKLEVAGTSKIEGADFAGNELEQALKESPEQLQTRSQRQAHAAVQAYRWIAKLGNDQPISETLVKEVHRKIIVGADDDHCPPGVLRQRDQNVTFGVPPHRGCEGGTECAQVFSELIAAVQNQYKNHDLLIQALAFHYHFAAMHPFVDGNGRTARALEALMLQRAGLKDTLFIAMSNYYHDEKKDYLASLSAVRAANYDLTPFLKFGLRGIAKQSQRLLALLNTRIRKELFRNLAHDLFLRLQTPRKRVIAQRQLVLIEKLLGEDQVEVEVTTFIRETLGSYSDVTNPRKAMVRDLNSLISLGALGWRKEEDPGKSTYLFARLDWPSKITESAFFEKIKQMPTSKTLGFLVAQ